MFITCDVNGHQKFSRKQNELVSKAFCWNVFHKCRTRWTFFFFVSSIFTLSNKSIFITHLLEINFAGIIGIKRTKDVRTESFSLSIGKKLTINLNEFFLGQFTSGTVELNKWWNDVINKTDTVVWRLNKSLEIFLNFTFLDQFRREIRRKFFRSSVIFIGSCHDTNSRWRFHLGIKEKPDGLIITQRRKNDKCLTSLSTDCFVQGEGISNGIEVGLCSSITYLWVNLMLNVHHWKF